MKAMMWKEFRENSKWAVLALIGLGLAEFYGLYYVSPNSQDQGITLCNPPFLMATTFGCALVGLALGFLQILPEQRRDRWAVLLHRPVSRDVIFRGKVAVGLLLYAIATLIPFLACVWLAATPGHFLAPFAPGLMLPGIADMCVGPVYYFAAMLCALQGGAWFGARTLALFAAVHVSFYVTGDYHFFHSSVLVALGMALVLFAAAWGAMVSNGKFRARPWLTRLALFTAVFYGIWGVSDLARTMLKAGAQQTSDNGRYEVTKEGIPIILTTNKDLSPLVTDLAGHPLHDERYIGQKAYGNFLFMGEICSLIGDTHGLDYSQRYPRYRNSYNYVNAVDLNRVYPLPTQWFLLPGSGYYIGISRLNKMPVKIADRMGFRSHSSTPQPFRESKGTESYSGYEPSLVNEGNQLICIDFEGEEMLMIPSPDGTRIEEANTSSFRTNTVDVNTQVVALVLAHALYVYDTKGKLMATLPFHQNVDRMGAISLGINAAQDRYYVEYGPSLWIDWAQRHLISSYLEEVDPKGNMLHSYILPPLWGPPPVTTWPERVARSLQAPAFWYGTVAYEKIGDALGIKHYNDRSYNANYPERSHPAKVGIHLLIVSLVMAPIALVWARLVRLPGRAAWGWAFLALVFNFAGLIAYRLVVDWPVRVPCPQCGRKRPLQDDLCPHCQAEWPKPVPRGIEIFDPEPASAIG